MKRGLIAKLEITLITDEVLALVVLGKASLDLTTSVAHSSCTTLAVVAGFTLQGAEFLRQRLVARETFLFILDLIGALELLGQIFNTLFLPPQLVILLLLM